MARTWSYSKRVDDQSAAQRVRNRPSSLTVFTAMLILTLIVFGGMVIYTAFYALRHPITEVTQPNVQAPKGD